MPWDGDIAKMGQLANRIADLAKVPSRASARVSRELADLIQLEFDEGADPYGSSWAPLAEATLAKGRHHPPLTDMRDMRNSLRVRPMRGAGVSITIAHPAQVHQTGWKGRSGNGPPRPILPARAMPELWAEAIEVAVNDELRRAS
jgi:hypothetical protein